MCFNNCHLKSNSFLSSCKTDFQIRKLYTFQNPTQHRLTILNFGSTKIEKMIFQLQTFIRFI